MARKTKEQEGRIVSIELCQSTLRMVSVSPSGPNQLPEVVTRQIDWRVNAHTLHSELGVQELTKAMRRLAAEEKLTGAKIRFTFNGDFCVTRVVTGTTERVRRELAQLEDRSQLYLSLGPGKKALAGSVQQLDARHQHALLTVTNQKTLDAVIQVTHAVGLQIELIEPSLVALARLINRLQYDQQEPVIVSMLDERGAELGISYQGQLLLDYRPGGQAVQEELADILDQHIARLQRYCFRYFRYAEGTLNTIYLVDSKQQLDQSLQAFRENGTVEAKALELTELAAQWNFAEQTPPALFAAAIGTALLSPQGEEECNSPNLMKDLQTQAGPPIWPALLRISWPVAAAIAIIAGTYCLKEKEKWNLKDLQAELQTLTPSKMRAKRLRLTLTRYESKEKQLQQLESQLAHTAWKPVLDSLANCLPNDVWVDNLQVTGGDVVAISGASYSEDGIYEFVKWLGENPRFSQVVLEGTRIARQGKEDAIKFELKCKLLTKLNSNDKGNSNG